jgi:hypothetical protein
MSGSQTETILAPFISDLLSAEVLVSIASFAESNSSTVNGRVINGMPSPAAVMLSGGRLRRVGIPLALFRQPADLPAGRAELEHLSRAPAHRMGTAAHPLTTELNGMISNCTDMGRPALHDLSHRVKLTLTRSSYPALAALDVSERQGVIVISGRLPSYYMKQIAQTIAGAVDGVRRLENNVLVLREEPASPQPTRPAAAPAFKRPSAAAAALSAAET